MGDQFYLVQLSYTSEAWRELVAWAASKEVPTAADRLKDVLALIAALGGRMVKIDCDNQKGIGIFDGKFVDPGRNDLVAILAFPSQIEALAFKVAVAAEPGVKSVSLTLLLPLAEAVHAIKMASARIGSYRAPGRGPKAT
ncbi:MAG: hypothetical protein JNM30_20955 [Rhodospirillales bacterium]|nr:hypothetical protein [Rhodospirillales bacterium]